MNTLPNLTDPSSLVPLATGNPYVGPHAFTEAEAPRFFGREREARELLALVLRERLVLFYAQSGAGKSSLLHTRLIPGLRNQGFEVLPVGRVSGDLPVGMLPDTVSNIFIYNLLLSLNGDASAAEPIQVSDWGQRSLLAFLVGEEGAPSNGASTATEELAPTVLIIDQFEEIMTTHPERWQERRDFFIQLQTALERLPNLWVVLTLREENVAALEPYAELLTNRLRARYYMERMGVKAALAAIQEPAKAYGRPFDPPAAEQLVDDLRRLHPQDQVQSVLDQYVEPVQLQVVCYQLWENLAQQRPPVTSGSGYDSITLADLAAAGDVDTALARFYEETVAKVLAAAETPVSERQLRTWFDSQLITPTGTRGLVLQAAEETGGLPNAVVRQLQARFLVRSESRTGSTWVELVHDRFVEPIRESNAAWLGLHADPLTQAAQAWAAAGKTGRLLYSGHRLREVVDQLRSTPAFYGALEKEFIAAAEQRERRVRGGITLYAMILVLLFAGLAAWGIWNAVQARRNEQQANAAAATAQAERIRANQEAADAKRARADADARRNEAELAKQVAEVSKADVERLNHSIRADSLTRYGIFLVDSNPVAALLLGVEGLRVQTAVSEAVAAAAQLNAFEILNYEILNNLQSMTLPELGMLTETFGVALSPDGRWLAIVDRNHYLWGLDLQHPSKKLLSTNYTVTNSSIIFSPDTYGLAVSDSNRIYLQVIQNSNSGFLIKRSEADQPIALSPHAHWLVTDDKKGSLLVWDGDHTQATPVSLGGYSGKAMAGVFSMDNHWLAIAGEDAIVRLWEVEHWTTPRTQFVGTQAAIRSAAFSADNHWLVTAGDDAVARLWDLQSPEPAYQPLVGHEGSILAVSFSADSRRLATAGEDATIRVWDLHSLDVAPIVLRAHKSPIHAIAFNTDDQRLTSAADDGSIRQWNVIEPTILHEYGSVLEANNDINLTAAVSPNGHWLATVSGTDQIRVRLWNMAEPTAAPTEFNETKPVKGIAFSPDSHWLAITGCDYYQSWIKIWEISGTSAWRYRTQNTYRYRLFGLADPGFWENALHSVSISALTFSPNGAWLVSAFDDTPIMLWNMADLSRSPIPLNYDYTSDSAKALAISADSHWLAAHITAAGVKTIGVWDLYNLATEPIILRGPMTSTNALAFKPYSPWLAAASDDATVWMWDITHADSAIQLRANTTDIVNLAFSPDGKSLATASTDGTVHIWNATGPLSESVFIGQSTGYVTALTFSSNGRWLAIANTNGAASIGLWRIADLVDSLCNIARRNLSLEEWARYFRGNLYRKTCPQWPAHPSVTQPLSEEAHTLATQGDIVGATTKFNELLEIDSSLDFNPKAEAEHIYAPVVVDEGRNLAQEGDIDGAIAKFEQALALDPSLAINPEAEAKRIYAPVVVDEGRNLAQEGDIDGAIAKFEQALALDPSLAIDPKVTVQLASARGLLARGAYTEAMTTIVAVETISPTFAITTALSAYEWNSICWYGTLDGIAGTVLPFCERAVAQLSVAGDIRNSRGLARALTGDIEGAIADFEFYIQWRTARDEQPERVAQRQEWIAALKAGQNPFDAATLAKLRDSE